MSTSKSSLRVPSARDQEIFRRVVVNCEKQSDVAAELNLSKGRISQILSRVRHWLANGQVQGSKFNVQSSKVADVNTTLNLELETLNHAAQQRFQRQLAQARHERCYQLLMREIARQQQHPTHTTTRTEMKPCESASDSAPTPIQNPKSKIQNSQSQIPNPKSEITKIVRTVRDAPLNVQLIKAAQRSAIELQKLAECDQLPESNSQSAICNQQSAII